MSTASRRRLVRDLKKMQNEPPSGINAAPMEDNIMVWQAVIFGPDDTPWEGGTFNMVMEFSEDYPNKPPKVRFVTPLFHPNVYVDGGICLDLLQSMWSPIYDVSSILTSVQSLLSDPNPSSPANAEAAALYSNNRAEYERRVRECVEASWLAAEPEAAGSAAEAVAAADTTAAAAAASSSSAAAAAAAPAASAGAGTPAAAPPPA